MFVFLKFFKPVVKYPKCNKCINYVDGKCNLFKYNINKEENKSVYIY